jgi:hypothetical protein
MPTPHTTRPDEGVRFSREWAMPSRWTFQIPPIADFLARWVPRGAVVVDPFSGESTLAQYRNDLARGGVDAQEYCDRLLAAGVRVDVAMFDPPYSPRQIAECYREAGREITTADTQNAALYTRVRKPLAELLRPGGVALSFGWNSAGFGKSWPIEEILLVAHGGAHNDTICVAQRKAGSLWEAA